MVDTAVSAKRELRYSPDVMDTATIDMNTESEEFDPKVVAIILNESVHGCALVMRATEAPELHSTCLIKVGRNAPYLAETVWVVKIEAEVIKAGFRFQE